MQENTNRPEEGEEVPDPEEIREQFAIENDWATLEPFLDEDEHRGINADDPRDIANWAEQFQISQQELKAAILLNGNSVKQIRKYLSA